MKHYYEDGGLRLFHGSNKDILPTFEAESYDSIVTDPPYELGFMGKGWDSSGIAYDVDMWRECWRVLKPGGYLLAFGGTRTWHRIATAIEDAGFEIRDSVAWMYAQGFPKSMNPGRDQRFCQGCEVEYDHADSAPETTEHGLSGVLVGNVSQAEGTPRGAAGTARGRAETGRTHCRTVGTSRRHGWGRRTQPGRAGDLQAAEGQLRGTALREVPGGPALHGEVGRLRDGAPTRHGSPDRAPAAEVGSGEPHQPRPTGQPTGEPGAVPEQRGSQAGRGGQVCAGCGKPPAPVGLGTALKPSFEPIVVARKPLSGTVAQTVLQHGTGALNIDACRVAGVGEPIAAHHGTNGASGVTFGNRREYVPGSANAENVHTAGRWPANVLLDESQAAELDRQAPDTGGSGKASGPSLREATGAGVAFGARNGLAGEPAFYGGEKGGASRFFPTFRYEAKAPTSERPEVDGMAHATVKPLDLMRWLVRLVTRRGGRVLDPFAGSGTTGEAALLEGMNVTLIELEESHLPLILQRVRKPLQPSMFGDWEETA